MPLPLIVASVDYSRARRTICLTPPNDSLAGREGCLPQIRQLNLSESLIL